MITNFADFEKSLPKITGRNTDMLYKFLDSDYSNFSVGGEFGFKCMNAFKFIEYHPSNNKKVFDAKNNSAFYPNAELINCSVPGECKIHQHLWHGHSFTNYKLSDIPLYVMTTIEYQIDDPVDIDILICPRSLNKAPKRNYKYWEELVESLLIDNVRIGVCGLAKETCAALVEDTRLIKSWECAGETPSSKLLKMMKGCKLYIGGDTGPTHLVHNFHKPSILFRMVDGTPNRIKDYSAVNPHIEYLETRGENLNNKILDLVNLF